MKRDDNGSPTVLTAGVKDRLPYILIPLAALIVILPLITNGCSCGHDFDFHILNWFEAHSQLAHHRYPQWADTPAWNAGEPRFVFYPPLSWLIGALLGALMPWTWTPIVYTWLALTAAGLGLYAAARDLNASPNAALLASLLYAVNPYTLFTAYERTAYAELLAAAWLPLLLAGILRDRPTIPRIAIPVALLWLTNAPAAVMGCYALALVALLRILIPAAKPSAPFTAQSYRAMGGIHAYTVTAVGGVLLGLGLAAVYLLPAVYERRWVEIRMAVLPGLSFAENFLFHRTSDPDHDKVLHTASIVAVLMLALTATVLFLGFRKKTDAPYLAVSSPDVGDRAPVLPTLAILTLVISFMLTPPSAFLWRHTPQLAFLQFPWRLVALLSVIFGLALAHLPALSNRQTLALLALFLAVAFTRPAYQAFHQPCYHEDTVAARFALFHSSSPGTEPTDEYTPSDADNDILAHNNPQWWLADDADDPAPKTSAQQAGALGQPANWTGKPGPAPHSLNLTLDRPQILILNLRRYPAWQIAVNGAHVRLASRDDGLTAIPLPAGPAQIRVTWLNRRDHAVGEVITMSSLLILVLLLHQQRELYRFIKSPSRQNP